MGPEAVAGRLRREGGEPGSLNRSPKEQQLVWMRSVFFIPPGTKVYEGMVVGENSREKDMTVNVCRTKQLTNMRASGSDEAVRLEPPHIMTLEQAIEWIGDDELVEVTPESIRVRKKHLDANLRNRMSKRKTETLEEAAR